MGHKGEGRRTRIAVLPGLQKISNHVFFFKNVVKHLNIIKRLIPPTPPPQHNNESLSSFSVTHLCSIYSVSSRLHMKGDDSTLKEIQLFLIVHKYKVIVFIFLHKIVIIIILCISPVRVNSSNECIECAVCRM